MDLEKLGPLKPEPAALIVGLACFFLMIWLLGRKVLPRIERVQADRRDATEGRLERAEELNAEADRTYEAYRKVLADARHEAARIRQEAAEQGAALIATAREEGLRERDRLVGEAHAQIAVDQALAAVTLRHDVGELAVELAGRVVGESVSAVAAERATVARFFDEH
ncbi:F0F1 ATP synthase subunit B [Kitasatospora sp. A2-31]|uniref:F0F1 ATP synthase subunit B n=1 Tax=Kitasatospora sp. A2-31 TaxID=2916414 RepID=UPI001EE8CCAF|nr:F0F1 ATP synthase subunit B [Kitasatospora sp. A2-31]MCG6493360.1 F0F1 ATP synthase subunit B [Kitasatospora sp. A2-31]